VRHVRKTVSRFEGLQTLSLQAFLSSVMFGSAAPQYDLADAACRRSPYHQIRTFPPVFDRGRGRL